ncbi:MAG: PD-(D/E)XK nuclease family protein [Pseudanabaena sp. ELA645]|jgi:hypothetical protein
MDADKTKERKILESFVVDNKDLEALESKVARFNIFEAIGMVRQEIKHSNFIGFLLDPSEKHQLKDLFIKKLLINILQHSHDAPLDILDVSISDFNDAEVRREWKNIDLLIYSQSNNFVCTIENKVDSSEGNNQLKNYSELIYKEFPKCKKIFVYLSKNGDEASEVILNITENGSASEVQVNWQSLSYTTIADIIETVCNDFRLQLKEDIYLSMCHYVDLIRRHIMSESDIAKLCRKIYKQHRQAIELIYEHRLDIRSDIKEYLGKIIQEFTSSEKGSLEEDQSTQTYIRFSPKEWDDLSFQKTALKWTKSKRILLFEFRNVPESLELNLVIGPGSIEIRKDISQKIEGLETELRVLKIKDCNIRGKAGWNYVCGLPILTSSDYTDESLEDLQEKIRIFWIEFVSKDLKTIRDAIYNSSEKISENTQSFNP